MAKKIEHVLGAALKVGDTIIPWHEKTATICALRPYTGPLAPLFRKGAQIATFLPGDFGAKGMTIDNGGLYRVVKVD